MKGFWDAVKQQNGDQSTRGHVAVKRLRLAFRPAKDAASDAVDSNQGNQGVKNNQRVG